MSVGVYQHIRRSVSGGSLNRLHIAAGDYQLIGCAGMPQTVEHDRVKKVYLSAILDLYDRRIISFVIRDTIDNKLVFDTFAKAVQSDPDAHPIFHSDRGFQYSNRYFYQQLVNAGMIQSMSRIGRCIDNGPMEGFWGILKRERYYGRRFTNRTELVKMIRSYIQYYNTKRLQRNLGVLTPMGKRDLYLKAA